MSVGYLSSVHWEILVLVQPSLIVPIAHKLITETGRRNYNNNSFSQHHRLTRPKMETTSGHVQSKQVHAIAILLNQIRLELNMLLQDKSISTRMCANIKEDSGLTLQY